MRYGNSWDQVRQDVHLLGSVKNVQEYWSSQCADPAYIKAEILGQRRSPHRDKNTSHSYCTQTHTNSNFYRGSIKEPKLLVRAQYPNPDPN